MKPAITIAAIIVGLAVVLAVTLKGPTANVNDPKEDDSSQLAESDGGGGDAEPDANGNDEEVDAPGDEEANGEEDDTPSDEEADDETLAPSPEADNPDDAPDLRSAIEEAVAETYANGHEGNPDFLGLREDDVITTLNGADFRIVVLNPSTEEQPTTIVVQRGGIDEELVYEFGLTWIPGGMFGSGGSTPTPAPDTYRPVFSSDLTRPLIGSSDPESDYELSVEIDPYRAGVHQALLTHYDSEVGGEERYDVLNPINLHIEGAPTIGSYAARSITINGQEIDLFEQDPETKQWRGGWTITDHSADSVTLTLLIQGGREDEALIPRGPEDAPVDIARITRTYSISPDSYTLQLEQTVTNLTDEPMTITWAQLGQGDIEYTPDYLKGRSQYFVLGYFNNEHDSAHFGISSDDGYLARNDVINRIFKTDRSGDAEDRLHAGVWPRRDLDDQMELAWLASTNRFFAIVTSTHVDPESDGENSEAIRSLISVYPTIDTSVYPSKKADPDLSPTERSVLLTMYSNEITLAPNQTSAPEALGLDIFIGPRDSKVFGEAPYKSMRLGNLIRYSLGGMCGFCTFAWLADGLLALLKFFHMITGDWGLAIIILVLVVRLCLHPLTKRGQISMMKMSKQMSKVAPEIAKLKKKYADNPQKFQQEQMKLYREKGINPAASAMGCLPMFFQMPIWIALYAMLYFVIELRHQPAFYDLFQFVSAGHWHFLADLSRSDQFIRFSAEPKLISLWLITFDYSHINILPLLMGFTFYFNMKLTTPPPTTEQQAQQQKIMKFMPFLFPVMLYSAPSALTLYICASTFAGMMDSYIVRKHIRELEESGELYKPKERKEGGLMDRMSKAVETAQQRAEQMKQQGKNHGPQHKKRKRK